VVAALTVQQRLQHGYAAFARDHALPAYVRRAAWAMRVCRTMVLGGQVQRCPDGHVQRLWDNSCRHRSCPQCAWLAIARWLAKQRRRLLAGEHDHVMFTRPDELRGLWRGNVRLRRELLFGTGRHTLCELLEDPDSLGGEPGMMAALPTWSQPLVLHPHLHGVVTGGGCPPMGSGVLSAPGVCCPCGW
jgi:hypothetical protein